MPAWTPQDEEAWRKEVGDSDPDPALGLDLRPPTPIGPGKLGLDLRDDEDMWNDQLRQSNALPPSKLGPEDFQTVDASPSGSGSPPMARKLSDLMTGAKPSQVNPAVSAYVRKKYGLPEAMGDEALKGAQFRDDVDRIGSSVGRNMSIAGSLIRGEGPQATIDPGAPSHYAEDLLKRRAGLGQEAQFQRTQEEADPNSDISKRALAILRQTSPQIADTLGPDASLATLQRTAPQIAEHLKREAEKQKAADEYKKEIDKENLIQGGENSRNTNTQAGEDRRSAARLASEERRAKEPKPEDARKNFVGADYVPTALPEKTQAEWLDADAASRTLLPTLQKYRNEIQKAGLSRAGPSAVAGRLNALKAELAPEFNKFHGISRLSETDVNQVIDRAIPSVTGADIVKGKAAALAAVDTLARNIREGMESRRKQLGIQIAPGRNPPHLLGGASGGAPEVDHDAAREWLKENPDDPRAAVIRDRLGAGDM